MNKIKIFFMVCAALVCMPVAAQTAVDTLSPKELKVKQKAELKAFKEKQKKELNDFIMAQKHPESANGENVNLSKPELTNAADSLAYLFGSYQSNGLKGYIATQLGVDTVHQMNKFCEGVLDRVKTGPADTSADAYYSGIQIGAQILNMAKALSKDYYAADPEKSISANIIALAILRGVMGQSEYTIQEAQSMFQDKMTARQKENKERLYGSNREVGEKWLKDNSTKEGVVVLPSGLQYKILTKGTGEVPKTNQRVKVDYEGRLIDGTVFDSSYKRGKPATFGLSQVVRGWTEALSMMPVGSKWEIYLPYDLAYGDRESGQIKPYSALIFTVELLGIEK